MDDLDGQIESVSGFDFSFGGCWDDDYNYGDDNDAGTAAPFSFDESRWMTPLSEHHYEQQDVSLEEGDVNSNSNNNHLLETLPPQLHPAVSMGVRRVSSCYFSIQSPSEASSSVADLLSLWDDNSCNNNNNNNSNKNPASEQVQHKSENDQTNINKNTIIINSCSNNKSPSEPLFGSGGNVNNNNITMSPSSTATANTAERRSILYHDIMMHVFSFLDPPSLAAFSQTARRPNFECFYYLQLQLQRELVVGEQHLQQQQKHNGPNRSATTITTVESRDDNANYCSLPPMAGVGYISRLAQLDVVEARHVVQDYLDSNSTLRTMPLSHSLAYLRDLLRRHGFTSHITSGSPSKALASAALLMTLVGAASFMTSSSSSCSSFSCGGGSGGDSTYMMMMMNHHAESLAELPQMLLKVGLAGSIMNAARRSMTTNTQHIQSTPRSQQGVLAVQGPQQESDARDAASAAVAAATTPSTNTSTSSMPMLSMRETAEQMASMMQQLPQQLLQQLQAMQTRMMNGGGGGGGNVRDNRTSATTAPIAATTATVDAGGGTGSTLPAPAAATASATLTSPSSNSSSLAARMFAAFSSASSSLSATLPSPTVSKNKPSNLLAFPKHGTDLCLNDPDTVVDRWSDMELLPFTPNPYEHLPNFCGSDSEDVPEEATAPQSCTGVCIEHETSLSPDTATSKTVVAINPNGTITARQPSPVALHRKLPSGCVGAYTRAIMRASTRATQLIKERRKAQFALPASTDGGEANNNNEEEEQEERKQIAAVWIDACSSDESLPLVREMVHRIDVDGFYVGSDGTETCALHAAAFSGAHGVLEFLCQGLDERDESADGGLALVNLQDANGWTALHFAAGANSVSATQVLVRFGADLMVEAANGYTPLQWAQRLSNKEVTEELQRAEYYYYDHHDDDDDENASKEPQYEPPGDDAHHHDSIIPRHQPFALYQQRHAIQHHNHYYNHNHRRRRRGGRHGRGPQLGPLSMFANRFFAMIPTHS